MRHSEVLVAAALLVREPNVAFRAPDLTHFINGGCAGRLPVGSADDYAYPANVRRRLLTLEDHKLVRNVSFGRFFITDRGWSEVLELTGGRWLL